MVIDQATLCRVGGEEQSLLIRDWQPIPSSYSQTDGPGILMSCALYTFVNAELCAACKHNNTTPLQEYTGGIGPLTLLMLKLAQWEISWLFGCKMANRPPAQISFFLAFGAGWPPECYHEFTWVDLWVKLLLIRDVLNYPSLCSDGDGYMNVLMAVLQQLCLSSPDLTLIGYRAFPLIGLLENKIGS